MHIIKTKKRLAPSFKALLSDNGVIKETYIKNKHCNESKWEESGHFRKKMIQLHDKKT